MEVAVSDQCIYSVLFCSAEKKKDEKRYVTLVGATFFEAAEAVVAPVVAKHTRKAAEAENDVHVI